MADIKDFTDMKTANSTVYAWDTDEFRRRYRLFITPSAPGKIASMRRRLRENRGEITESTSALVDSECNRVMSVLPPDYDLDAPTSPTCKFCADDSDVRSAESFACLDFGHERSTPGGKLPGTTHGHILPVAVSCCSRCKRNFYIADLVPTAVGVAFPAAAFFLLTGKDLRIALMEVATIIPAAVLIGAAAIGVIAAFVCRRILRANLAGKTRFNIDTIPELAPLLRSGWFCIQTTGKVDRPAFTKTLPEYNSPAPAPELDESEPVYHKFDLLEDLDDEFQPPEDDEE